MSKFRAQNGRDLSASTQFEMKYMIFRLNQMILIIMCFLKNNFVISGAPADQPKNLSWKNETRGTCQFWNFNFHFQFFPIYIFFKFSPPQVQSSHSKEEEGGHAHQLSLAWVDTNTGKDIVVDLNLNRDLIPESYAERYHHQVKL